MKYPLTCLLLLFATAGQVNAKNLGVQGNVWPIVEVDMRQLMVESAGRTNWGEVSDKAVDSAKRYLESLPKRSLPSPEKTVTTWVNPSVRVASDIQVPVKRADGTYEWQVLAPKGTLVNPLTQVRPVTAMLLFDGANESQLKMVKAVLGLEKNRILPVEAGSGDMKNNNETMGRPVFYASDAMMNRFQVKFLPALIYPGYGAQELLLGVTSFAAPYAEREVLSAWPVLTDPSVTVKKTAQ